MLDKLRRGQNGDCSRRLQESSAESSYRYLVEQIRDCAIIQVTPNGIIQSWNSGAELILGYTADQIIGAHYRSLFELAAQRERHPERLLEIAVRVGHADEEGWRVREDRSRFWAGESMTALRDEHGRVRGFAIITRDLTARCERETELERSKAMMDAIFGSSSDAIVTCNETGVIDNWNEAATQLFGWHADEVRGKAVSIIIPPHLRPKQKKNLRHYLQSGESSAFGGRLEMVALHKSGQSFPVEVQLAPWQYGGEQYLSAVVRDITDSKQADEHLQRYNRQLVAQKRELRRFAYLASHDLQEPLRTLTSFTNLLDQKYGSALDDDGRRSVQYINRASRRMAALIDDLLNYSDIGDANTPEPVDCNDVVASVLAELSETIDSAGAEITVEDLPVITGFREEIRTLFRDLISNALKFRAPGRPLRIAVDAEAGSDRWRFLVRDNGIGIDPAHHEKIFQVFQRLHAYDSYEGTGIGLANCKKVAVHHGGDIWVESRPGQGSAFNFTILKSLDEEKARMYFAD